MKIARNHIAHGLPWSLFLSISMLFIGCAQDGEEQGNDQSASTNSKQAVRTQALTKGSAGATAGDSDYCDDAANPCAAGEGDCDTNDQCSGGLVCVQGMGGRWGYSDSTGVCAQATCSNSVQDGDETGIDCGGSCGTCSRPTAYQNGGENYCAPAYPCSVGEGHCRSDADCQSGLTCASGRGGHHSLDASTSVCEDATCSNGTQDGTETAIDCGGICGDCAPSILNSPASQQVLLGGAVDFIVSAEGGNLSYQWSKDGALLSSETASTLSLSSVAASDQGAYQVTVSNGVASVTSATATLSILDSTPPTLAVDPASSETFDDVLVLTGSVSDDVSETLEIRATNNQLPAIVFTATSEVDGGYSLSVPLEVGENTLSVVARDGSGNDSTPAEQVVVERKVPLTPEISIGQPQGNIQTIAERITVQGSILTSLTANDFQVRLGQRAAQVTEESAGVYAFAFADVELSLGSNLLEVTVQSNQGIQRAQVLVERISASSSGGASTISIQVVGGSERWVSDASATIEALVISSDCVEAVLVDGVAPTSLVGLYTNQASFEAAGVATTGAGTQVSVDATGCSGQTASQAVVLKLDEQAPTVTFTNATAGGSQVVTAKPFVLEGTLTEANLAGAMLNGQSLTTSPGASAGEWDFQASLVLDRGVDTPVTIQVWDLAGNRTSVTTTLRLDTPATLVPVKPLANEQVLVQGASGDIQLRVDAQGGSPQDVAEYLLSSDQSATWVPMTPDGDGFSATLTLDAGQTYTLDYRLLDSSSTEIATTSVTFEVVDQASIPVALIRSNPENGAFGVEANDSLSVYLNREVDPALLEVRVTETVHGYNYASPQTDADIKNMSIVEKVSVHREQEPKLGTVQNLPGNSAFVFYPSEEWAYGATVFVDVVFDGTSVGRHSFVVRDIPTLAHGFVIASGEPVPGTTVEFVDLGYQTKTNEDGAFNFGWGWSADKILPPGRHRLRINHDNDIKDHGSSESWVVIHEGEINALGTREIPFTPIDQSKVFMGVGVLSSFHGDRLTVDLSQATSMKFPGGSSQGVATASLRNLNSSGFELGVLTEGAGFSISPGGIEVEGPVSLSMKLPEFGGDFKYFDALHHFENKGEFMWLLGIEPVSLEIKVIGLLEVDRVTRTASTQNPLDMKRLDFVGFGLVMPYQLPQLERFFDGKIAHDELIETINISR